MAEIDWFNVLDFNQALTNLHFEFHGDWHRDPWGWPELKYMLAGGKGALIDFMNSSGAGEISLLDVPKENWGTRPAVVMEPVGRIAYQTLVDRLSLDVIGKVTPNAFGWRLPVTSPTRGRYSHNNKQWDLYRDHLSSLSGIYPVALKSDIVSFFASIPLEITQDELSRRTPSNSITKRLLALLDGFNKTSYRSGLPQRSTASSVIANMIMISIDDVLEHYASPLPVTFKSGVRYHSFARWMDDIWLFVQDAGKARRAQIEMQRAAQSLGLNLNAAKTELLEGSDVVEQAREIEHSAVDSALLLKNDSEPLEALIDKILDAPDLTSRTSIKFTTLRMRRHDNRYRVRELVQLARRMPHAADSLAELFKVAFTKPSLQDWFIDYARSDWAAFEWATAQYGRMFGSNQPPSKAMMDYVESIVANSGGTSLSILAVASQRLAAWDSTAARAVIRAAMPNVSNPQARRVLSMASLNAGEPRRMVKKWLAEHDSNRITLEMLEARHFRAYDVVASYAD